MGLNIYNLLFTRKKMTAILFVVMAIPLFVPLRLPMVISFTTKDFYNELNSLKPGSVIAYGATGSLATVQTQKTFAISLFQFMFEHKLKIIFVCLLAVQSAQQAALYMDVANAAGFGYVYGTDYVIFPYIAGEEVALAAAASDFFTAYSVDYFGKPIKDLPLLKNVRSFYDVDLIVAEAGGESYPEMMARQWPQKFNKHMIIIGRFMGAAPFYGPYITGCLDLMRGRAEWELIVNRPGNEVRKMESRNLGGLWWFMAIAVGFVAYHTQRVRKEREKREIEKEGQKT